MCVVCSICSVIMIYCYGTTYFRGATIDTKDSDQRTPLHLAAKNGHSGAVKILLEKNSDIEARDKFEDQPIHAAAKGSKLRYGIDTTYSLVSEQSKQPILMNWVAII